jgi:uncharacterized protein YprB with RNaseH-like and TPR domain/predicted RNA-binding Zn-ribbon protein involved in translation (DUF1610 family)
MNRKARIIIWDLETTNLKGNFGYILCGAWKVYGEKKIHCVSITDTKTFDQDPTNDKLVCKELLKSLEGADMWVAHFGRWFDRTMLNTRLIGHGLTPLPPIPMIDTWKIAKDNLKLNSNRLATIADWLGVEEKTPLNGKIWIKAMAGHKPSIKYVIKHCRQDVLVLEQVYERIRCLHQTHPNVNIVHDQTDGTGPVTERCPICGEQALQRRGKNIARTRWSQRYQCRNCGGWSKGPPKKHPELDIKIR